MRVEIVVKAVVDNAIVDDLGLIFYVRELN